MSSMLLAQVPAASGRATRSILAASIAVFLLFCGIVFLFKNDDKVNENIYAAVIPVTIAMQEKSVEPEG